MTSLNACRVPTTYHTAEGGRGLARARGRRDLQIGLYIIY